MAHWGMEDVQACFGDTADLNTRQITVGGQRLGLLFLDGLTSGGDIAEQVLKPLMETVTPGSIQEVLTQAEQARVYCAVAERTQDPAQTADKLLHGYCAVIFPGTDTALCFETKTSARRGPSAPESENTVKGAKDAFTETMRINTSLLRRHLRTAQLRFLQKTVGLRTKTAVTVCYLADLTAPELVRRMEKRLENIDIDGMLTPASVEEYVTGSRRTAFPLLQYTERPDTFCQGLLNGQVGLLVDGLPLGYLAPVDLGILMKSTEDRAVDYLSASCLRVLRYLALLAALLLPGLYVAMATYHQEMIPTKLLLAIIDSKQEVPFDTVFEVIGLLAAFELLQEAGLHLPQAIGTAVSIIGGLAVGEPTEVMYDIIDAVEPYMPKDKPRYLMGVGTPSNIIESVARGIDFFDCVMPARNARHGKLFTWQGAMNMKNAKYTYDDSPIDPQCDCPVCRRYSRAYIRHLFKAEEMLAMRLSVMHNLYFYNKLTEKIRDALDEGTFADFRAEYSRKLDEKI